MELRRRRRRVIGRQMHRRYVIVRWLLLLFARSPMLLVPLVRRGVIVGLAQHLVRSLPIGKVTARRRRLSQGAQQYVVLQRLGLLRAHLEGELPRVAVPI